VPRRASPPPLAPLLPQLRLPPRRCCCKDHQNFTIVYEKRKKLTRNDTRNDPDNYEKNRTKRGTMIKKHDDNNFAFLP
jgi:hypothetical protein